MKGTIRHLRRNWRFWGGALLAVGALAVLFLTVDRAEVAHTLAGANYLYLLPAIAVYFVGQYVRAIRWGYILRPLASIPARRLFPVVNLGYLANNILPARIGEIVRAVVLSRREPGVAAPAATATIVVERTYDALVLVLIGAAALPAVASIGTEAESMRRLLVSLSVVMSAVMVGTLFMLTVVAGNRRLQMLLLWAARRTPRRLRRHAVRGLSHFLSGLGMLDSPWKHLAMFGMSCVVYLMELAVYVIVGFSFGVHESFDSMWTALAAFALVMSVSNIVSAVPVSAGGIGPFEVVAQQTLMIFGVSGAVAASYAVTVHVVALWLPVNLVGLVVLMQMNWSLRRFAAAADEIDSAGEGTAGEGNAGDANARALTS